MNTVESFYDSNAQTEWERFDRHKMEFAITKRALAEHLPPPSARILDCGGGPGRYAIHLAKLGYEVTLLDLSQGNLSLAREKAAEHGAAVADFIHGNALDLSRFADASFDAVLLMGPLYHMVEQSDRDRAVREAVRVLKPGGPLFAGFITFYAPLRDSIAKGYLRDFYEKPDELAGLMDHQRNAGEGFTEAWFAKPSQVIPWLESLGLRTRAMLAVEGVASGHEQHMNALDEDAFEFWADLTYLFSTDPHLWGAADHLLWVGEDLNAQDACKNNPP